MRNSSDHINKFRVKYGIYASPDKFIMTGAFEIPMKTTGKTAMVISSDGLGWEHVSVSLPNRCPNWEEMCYIKDLFWQEDEVVIQIHPAKKDYINNHPFCLHLWRPIDREIPLPESVLVGEKGIIPIKKRD